MLVSGNTRLRLQLQKLAFILLLLVVVGLLGWLTNHHSIQFDWTSNKRNTLSQSSIELLNTLESAVSVTVFVQDDETVHAAVREILRRYQREKNDFSFRLVNPDIDFDAAQREGVERYGQIIIEYDGNKEILSSLSESSVTNALLKLSRSDNRRIVYIKGHGERSISGDTNTSYRKLVQELESRGFEVEAQNLLLSSLPADTAVLVVAAPSRELPEGELAYITTYVEDGGNLLWMMDPGDMQGMDKLAEILGIAFQPGIIVDDNTNLRNTLRIQHPAMIPVLEYVEHPLTRNIQYNTLFPFSRGVGHRGNDFDATTVIQSLPKSWSETSAIGTEIVFEPDNGDKQGPVAIAIALERPRGNATTAAGSIQRVIVTGDSDFLANSYIGAGANMDLGMNMFNWLAGDDKLIAIEPKSAPDLQLQLNDTEILLIGGGFLVLLPAGLIVAGVFIWLRRRKR